MIQFQELMKAIHMGIFQAVKSAEMASVRQFNRFFEPVTDENGDSDKDNPNLDFDRKFKPRTITMEFPSRTEEDENGLQVKMVEVEVPLIAITPINIPELKEVKFKAQLELSVDSSNNLNVAFPTPKAKSSMWGKHDDSDSMSTNFQLEVTFCGSETPEGLQKVIDGYERALRSQIPG